MVLATYSPSIVHFRGLQVDPSCCSLFGIPCLVRPLPHIESRLQVPLLLRHGTELHIRCCLPQFKLDKSRLAPAATSLACLLFRCVDYKHEHLKTLFLCYFNTILVLLKDSLSRTFFRHLHSTCVANDGKLGAFQNFGGCLCNVRQSGRTCDASLDQTFGQCRNLFTELYF